MGFPRIHTPGHTPGSISLYDPEIKLIFVGDTLITRKGIINGPPLVATYDLAKALESAKKAKLINSSIQNEDTEHLKPKK